MIFVDRKKCSGCALCVEACPQGAIRIQDSIAVIDQRLCRQCEVCAEVCSAGAIRVVEPVYAKSRKGGDTMRGRGWFGWGCWGWGRGNPYLFCRFYPWLPRRWWAYGRGAYPQMAPSYGPVYQPYWQW
ncbi:MAG TPA: 4Fe-4S binding protein [Dehalococcoidia bacterium]|nr:4Fe-4S binding protein [Dehalococcoidia bacterium]